MKKNTLFIMFFLLSGMITIAQVGINKDNSGPDASAGLDVNFTNKGFLPPRVALTAINSALPVSSPATGLLVYNTSTSGTSPNNVVPGYYSWNGTNWISVSMPQGMNPGEMLYWNGTQSVIVPVGANGQILTFNNGAPTWQYQCGSPINRNHVAGAVAPVTKTVIYGTVNDIAGEPYKCWITSNLGSDHPASAVNDDSEVSAGWYWQFNRKSGFKHDGITLTPAWTITVINENSDWLSANDPCTIELGQGWRIPSNSEWYNVNTGNGWTDWNSPWNSNIKLHAAGYLSTGNGGLNNRGTSGCYWSSTQFSSENGWYLNFSNSASGMQNLSKADGFPLRCLRD